MSGNTEDKKKSFIKPILNFAKSHLKNAYMGGVTGIMFYVGGSVGLVGAMVAGFPLAGALFLGGVGAVSTAIITKRCFKPEKKLTFYTSTALTVLGLSGAFNGASYQEYQPIEVKHPAPYVERAPKANKPKLPFTIVKQAPSKPVIKI